MEREGSHRQRDSPDQRSLEARTQTENKRFFVLAARTRRPGSRFDSNLDQLNEILAEGWRVTGALPPPEAEGAEGGAISGWIVLLRREGGG
ncbi:MAG: hypothetical protein AB1505_12480 [Candidatus Latescibacterota bacterium]